MSSRRRETDEETVARVARLAGMPLDDDLLADQLQGLRAALDAVESWHELPTGYVFSDATFANVPIATQFRPDWRVPSRLTKGRIVVERDGDVFLERPPKADEQ